MEFFKERPYQKEAGDSVMNYFEHHEDPGNAVIVLPTGTGKTIVLAGLCDRLLTKDPSASILVLSHVSEIIEQDYKALIFQFGDGVGIYSSGLGYRQIEKITVAGIQSVNRNREEFSHFDYVIVDEAHTINPNQKGMYRNLFKVMKKKIKVIGLTATPFRLGSGYIHEGKDSIFDTITCDYSTGDKFQSLIDEGYLCRLIGKRTNYEMDTSGVQITAGDFNNKALAQKLDRDSITEIAVKETIQYGKKYKKWLIFAIDIHHAENIAKMLNDAGIPTGCVHSRMEGDRKPILEQFREGELRAIVNVNVLTTGFDVPDIDMIAMMRPTSSPVVHVQTLGRGTRPSPGKTHCLVLDFGGNIKRLGTIDDITVKKKKKKGKGGPCAKECQNCHALNHIRLRECQACGEPFEIKEKLTTTADASDAIKFKKKNEPDQNNQTLFMVDNETYTRHEKYGMPDSVVFNFHCGMNRFRTWVCIEHNGYAKAKAIAFLRRRFGDNYPKTVSEFFERQNECRKTEKILVEHGGKFPEILTTSLVPEQNKMFG